MRLVRGLAQGMMCLAVTLSCGSGEDGLQHGSGGSGLDQRSGGASGSGGAGGGDLGSGGSKAESAGGSSGNSSGLGTGGSVQDNTGGGSGYDFGAEISIDGRRILIGGEPIHIKGVCWNPVPKGATHPDGLDFVGLAPVDIPLMKAAGINAIRTYEPLLDLDVLDQLAAAEIYVINSVFPFGNDPAVVVSRVNATKHHPAILMWAIGNEWNYNGFYADVPFEQAVVNIKQAITLINQNDGAHPVTTIYGELPDSSLLEELKEIDVWGINAYRGLSFDGLIEDFAALSGAPLFLSEFGADAWDARNGGSYNPTAQAEATTALVQELIDKSAALSKTGIVVGGTIFEWADEWWKAEGSPSVQDNGGVAPGGGPHPDATFNEEWWGLVDVDRQPRPAYDALRAIYTVNQSEQSGLR